MKKTIIVGNDQVTFVNILGILSFLGSGFLFMAFAGASNLTVEAKEESKRTIKMLDKDQLIPRNQLKHLLAEIKISENGSPLSDSFESAALCPPSEEDFYFNWYPRKFKTGTDVFSLGRYREADENCILGTGDPKMVITVMDNGRTNRGIYVIAVWDVMGDNLKLRTILNNGIVASYSSAEVTEAVPIDENRCFFIGRTFGGDEGYVCGSFWVGLWTKPRSFRIVYEDTYRTGEDDYEAFYQYSYKLDRKTMILSLEKIKKIDSGEVKGDKRIFKILDKVRKKVDLSGN